MFHRNHEIIPKLGTPDRNHIVFPGIGEKKKQGRLIFPGIGGKKNQGRLKLLSLKEVEELRKRRIKLLAQNRSTRFGTVKERTVLMMKKKVGYPSFSRGNLTKKLGQGFPRQDAESQVADVPVNSLRANKASVQAKLCTSSKADNSHLSVGKNHSGPSMRPYVVKPKKQDFPSGKSKTKNTVGAMPAMEKVSNTLPSVDTELEKRYCTCLGPMLRHAA